MGTTDTYVRLYKDNPSFIRLVNPSLLEAVEKPLAL